MLPWQPSKQCRAKGNLSPLHDYIQVNGVCHTFQWQTAFPGLGLSTASGDGQEARSNESGDTEVTETVTVWSLGSDPGRGNENAPLE